jgi:hypothetical protein
MSLLDFSPIHKWINYYYLQNNGWVYNGSGLWLKKSKRFIYCCRGRDHEGTSILIVQLYIIDSNNLIPISYPKTIQIKTLDRREYPLEDTGPQDARLFEFKSKIWAIFNMITASGHRKMHIFNVSNGGRPIELTIKNSAPRPVEKNWTPFVRHSKLHFIYSFAPKLIILAVDIVPEDGPLECIVVHVSDSAVPANTKGHLRGGTIAIETNPGEYCGYLHETISIPIGIVNPFDKSELPIPASNTNVYYRTRSFRLKWNLDGLSKPNLIVDDHQTSYFGKQIELVYAWDGEKQIIVNVNDAKTLLIEST